MDDRLARLELEVQKSKLEAAESDLSAAVQASKRSVDKCNRLLNSHAAVGVEALAAPKGESCNQADERVKSKEATVRRGSQIAVKKRHEISLELYEIRSPVRGVVKAILKHRGEAVKSLETVVEIQETRKE